jgi:hypothetical protein
MPNTARAGATVASCDPSAIAAPFFISKTLIVMELDFLLEVPLEAKVACISKVHASLRCVHLASRLSSCV